MYCLHFIVTLLIEEVSVAFALFPSPHFMTPTIAEQLSQLFGFATGTALAGIFFLVFGEKIFNWSNARRIKKGLPPMQAWRKIAIKVIAIVLILYAVLYAAIDASFLMTPNSLHAPSSSVTQSSSDQAIALTFPAEWKKVTGLNAQASVQASNGSDAWALVISEKKADFTTDLSGYSKIIIDNMSQRLTNFAVISGPEKLTINNLPALEYQVSGDINNTKPIFLIDIVEGKTQYHQMVGYALQSNFQTELPVFQSIFYVAKIRD